MQDSFVSGSHWTASTPITKDHRNKDETEKTTQFILRTTNKHAAAQRRPVTLAALSLRLRLAAGERARGCAGKGERGERPQESEASDVDRQPAVLPHVRQHIGARIEKVLLIREVDDGLRVAALDVHVNDRQPVALRQRHPGLLRSRRLSVISTLKFKK